MKLTTVERLLLLNQFEILKRLSSNKSDKADYELKISALSDGYDDDFDQMYAHIPEPLSPQVMEEVREILDMFRALGPKDGGRVPAAAHFIGFDGNDEGEYYAYATFLLEERGLWRESHRDDYNTHSPVLPKYRAMLQEWRACKDKNNPTPDEVKRIIAKTPYGSVNAAPARPE